MPDTISDGMPRRILRNTLSLTGANFGCAALSFVATAWMARVLTAEGFGIIGFAQAILTYFMLLTNLGFAHYGVREVARAPEKTELFVNNIITMRVVAAALGYAGLAVVAAFIPKPLPVKIAILILGMRLFNLTFHLRWVFQSKEKVGWISLSRLLPQILYAVSVLTLITNRERLLAVPALQVLTGACGVIILFVLYIRSGHRFRFTIDLPFWKNAARQSLPMAASFMLSQIYVNFDMILLGFTHGETTVGHYSAAYKAILAINLLATYYFFNLFPNMSRLFVESRERLENLIATSLKYASIGLMPVAVGGMVLAGPLMMTAFGEGYTASVIPFSIIVWNIAIINIRQHFNNALIACDLQKRYLVAAGTGAVINIALNFIFIPRYGMPAAAATTIFTEIVVLCMMYRDTRRVIKPGLIKHLARPLPASLGMGAVLFILPEFNVFLKILTGIGTYMVLALVTRTIRGDDIARLKELVKGSR
ncbi:MAG: flippase [Bacteroidales bacterium]|nr:flippase [Candidatus Latescibacterota bacterium]